MIYVTGTHALNLPCSLDTCGDWHASALKWENITLGDTENSIYGEWGIERGRTVPNMGPMPVADHIRALLDLLAAGRFGEAGGMNEDFICNPAYDGLVFDKVWEMRGLPGWGRVDRFMRKEYLTKWTRYRRKREGRGTGKC